MRERKMKAFVTALRKYYLFKSIVLGTLLNLISLSEGTSAIGFSIESVQKIMADRAEMPDVQDDPPQFIPDPPQFMQESKHTLSIKPNYQGSVCITGRAYKSVTITTIWWMADFHPFKEAEVALKQKDLSPARLRAVSGQLQMFREADKKNLIFTKKTAYYAEFTVPSENDRPNLFGIDKNRVVVSDKTASLKYGRCHFPFITRFLMS
jgi:hypothetical protein